MMSVMLSYMMFAKYHYIVIRLLFVTWRMSMFLFVMLD